MTAEDRLEVWLYGRHVADVIDNGDGLVALVYTDQAQAAGAAARLSLALPVRAEPYPSLRGGTRWASALLPEGRALDAVVRQWQVPADDIFALLSVVGRDVAGAATIVRPGEDPTLPDAGYRPLDDTDLAEVVTGVEEHPLGLDVERGVRLSLAGLQDKVLLHRPHRSRRLHQPVNGAPSTLIVKPEPEGGSVDLAGLASNELFGLKLARVSQVHAADAYAIMVAGQRCLVVERYDRDRHTDPPTRVHQEDLLMAMGRDHRLKYQQPTARRVPAAGGLGQRAPVRSEPGPGLANLANLLRAHLGIAGLLPLVEAVTFNVLLGNADAHARNYSVLLQPDGRVGLAPLYDLVCTRMYPGLSRTAAQQVNGVDDLDEITIDDAVAEAVGWGLPAGVVRTTVHRIVDRVVDALDRAATQSVDAGADADVVAHVRDLVADRAERVR